MYRLARIRVFIPCLPKSRELRMGSGPDVVRTATLFLVRMSNAVSAMFPTRCASGRLWRWQRSSASREAARRSCAAASAASQRRPPFNRPPSPRRVRDGSARARARWQAARPPLELEAWHTMTTGSKPQHIFARSQGGRGTDPCRGPQAGAPSAPGRPRAPVGHHPQRPMVHARAQRGSGPPRATAAPRGVGVTFSGQPRGRRAPAERPPRTVGAQDTLLTPHAEPQLCAHGNLGRLSGCARGRTTHEWPPRRSPGAGPPTGQR